MRSDSIYVRARDGALYLDPVLVFPEGFVCFSSEERPEVVFWLDDSTRSGIELVTPPGDKLQIIWRRLGRSANITSITHGKRAQRVIPGSDPWEYRHAISYFISFVDRIPRPQRHDGTVRYERDCDGAAVMDWPAHRSDPHELDMPEG